MASVQPAPLEQVLHQLANDLAELTRILSGQERSEHAQNKQLVAQNSPETKSDVEMSTQLPLEVETILCATPVAGSDLTEAIVSVEVSTDATRGVHESTTASEPPLEIAPLPCGAPATNPDISTEAVPANVSTDAPPDTSENTATPAPPQLDDSNPPEDVVTVTGAPSEVSGSPVVSELPQPDAIVRLPRDLDEWFVSPLPTGIRMKIFQAAGTSFLMSHPLFGFMTLKLNLEKAGASTSILEEFTEDPSAWASGNSILKSHIHNTRTTSKPSSSWSNFQPWKEKMRSNFKTIRHGTRELFVPDSGTPFLSSQTDRVETPLGKVWLDKLGLMHEIQDTHRLDELMFDRSLQVSKRYFSLLQFLKLASNSLEETASNFGANHRHFLEAVSSATQTIRDDELNGVKESWKYVAESISVSTKKLQGRVNQQIEDLKVHQESMFNATSLRETNNGMALNRSVYVLTAFTILYTPIGFMATFWALPFLNSPSDGGKPKVPDGFQESFITVPILTYFIAFVSCLYLGSSRFRKISTQIVLGYRAYLFDLFGPVKYIWDVLLKFTEPFRVAIREIHRQRATVSFSPTRARTWTQGITGASGDTNQTQPRTEGV
ncbi:hypothetical protein CPAR01_16291 [Colletotrichum paranaense]|uniref:Ankyrin repeat protein n=1 Tax=Colletotrichum paranaense TaxID=1914294 RepID=A0ABQ9RWC4_9PEZI|nr:uncharacterized protein CPAR01_16291 [Colletotrichum paranaense]KAK1516675.1 hypothetical protein CPAR01_16291 [Colletotrichum paranaense]